MFSGIVEETAKVVGIVHDQDNVHLILSCSFVDELSIDQSVAHNGVCLTVVSIQEALTPLPPCARLWSVRISAFLPWATK